MILSSALHAVHHPDEADQVRLSEAVLRVMYDGISAR
jgi:hypothetical protein